MREEERLALRLRSLELVVPRVLRVEREVRLLRLLCPLRLRVPSAREPPGVWRSDERYRLSCRPPREEYDMMPSFGL